jgi:hypothetical protein
MATGLLTEINTFDSIQGDLGDGWTELLTYITYPYFNTGYSGYSGYSGEALSYMTTARNTSIDSAADNPTYNTNSDASITLSTALRTAENNTITSIKNAYGASAKALNTAIIAIGGSNVKTYFKDTMCVLAEGNYAADPIDLKWHDGFRKMWRYIMQEELIVPVGEWKRGASAWAMTGTVSNGVRTWTNSDGIVSVELACALEIRPLHITSNIYITQIVFELPVDVVGSGSVTKTYTGSSKILIPATTGSTPYPVISLDNGTTRYTGISSITIESETGTQNDIFQIWTK